MIRGAKYQPALEAGFFIDNFLKRGYNKLTQAEACDYQIAAILNYQVAATFRLRKKRNPYVIKLKEVRWHLRVC